MSKRSPRLRFSDEERNAPELKKAIKKADKAVDKLEKAEAKIPQKKVKKRVVDSATGKVTTRLSFEEKKKPPSKLSHAVRDAPLAAVSSQFHREISKSENDNVGVESAHSLEKAIEGGGRTVRHIHRSRKLKPYRNAARMEKKADKANLKALDKQAQREAPTGSNPLSRFQQKKAIRKEYAAAKAGNSAASTAKGAQNTAKTAQKTAEESKKVGGFIARHKKGFLIVGGIAAIILLLFNTLSSCSVLFQGGAGGVAVSTYPSEDADMLAAEAQYAGMEAELQSYLDNYESTHSYDEYHYDLDSIEHDPYVLISMLTALHGGAWTVDEVQSTLQMLFDRQYILTETVEVEERYYYETDTWTDDEGNTHTDTYRVYYDYYICTVTLENFNLSHVPVYIMGETQLSMYALYMGTLGNRPDLFPNSAYIARYITGNYTDYDIPPEALEDEAFAAMIAEAERYLGFPYVWGGSSPSTSFDCSGFVSHVINSSGWDVGRLGAQGLYNICTPVSASAAKPGDLIFFHSTYDAGVPVTHVGIYVGQNYMIHCGDPISYASIETSYWQSHLYAYGRLPGN